MVGNVVGFGNFVRFLIQVVQNGGGVFMVLYFIVLFFFGILVMWVEWVVGCYGGKYGYGIFGLMYYFMVRESFKFRSVFWFGVIFGMLVFLLIVFFNSYYLYLIGWLVVYIYFSVVGFYFGQFIGEFFSNYLSNYGQVMFFWGIIVILFVIVVGQGVSKGIECWVKVMMLFLYVFVILMIIYIFIFGFLVDLNWSIIDGFCFIWILNWSYFGDYFWQVMLVVIGQIFFMLFFGMSIIQNYVSYFGLKDDVVFFGIVIVLFNEFVEVVFGGLIVILFVIVYVLKIVLFDVFQQGKIVVFEWIGQKFGFGFFYISFLNVFVSMGDIGRFFGVFWFFLLWFVGFILVIVMYNYFVVMFEEDMYIKRLVGIWVIFFVYFIVGFFVIYIDGYMDQVDVWVSFQLILLVFFDIIIVVYFFKLDNFWREFYEGVWIKVLEFYKWVIFYIVLLLFLIFMIGYFKLLVQMIFEWLVRLVIIFMWIFGVIESYYVIKKKYKEEFDKNEVIIKV